MAVVISVTTGLIVFIVIIVISVLICLFVKPDVFKGSRVNVFFMSMTALSVILLFLFYIALIQIYQAQNDLFTAQETIAINSSIFDFVDSLRLSSTTNPKLVKSVLPLMPCRGDDTSKCVDRVILSYQIFSVWSGILSSVGFAQFDELAFTTAFLQRANSKELFEDWHYLKINFSSRVQQFGDLLFEYGLPITDQTPKAYVAAAKRLLQNPQYKSIIENLSN